MKAKTLYGDQEIKDKKMIDKGIKECRTLVISEDYQGAKKIIASISPASFRLHFRQFEIAILRGGILIKQKEWSEAKAAIQSAIRLQSENPLPWKMLIQIEDNNGTAKDLSDAVLKALENSKPDKSLISVIAPFLKKIDDKNITKEFCRVVLSVPDCFELDISDKIPENPDTFEIREKLIKWKINNLKDNCNACSDLIHLYLEEGNPWNAIEIAKLLPEGHQDKIYVDALFGDDPINSAKKHFGTGSNIFKTFLLAVNEGNIQKLKSEVSLIPAFLAGWIYVAGLIKDQKQKINCIYDALQKFKNNLKLLTLLAKAKEEDNDIEGAISVIKEIQKIDHKIGLSTLLSLLIRQNRPEEAIKILETEKNLDVSTKDRAVIEFQLYLTDHNKNRLKNIIQLPDEQSLGSIKAEAVWELRNDLGDECEKLFSNALKCDKTNPKIYLLFGKWELETKNEIEKSIFLLKKAIEFNIVDPQAYEIVSKRYIEEGEIEKALNLCLKVDTDWSHFRAGLIYQRLEQHDLAVPQFQADLRFNSNRIESWDSLGYSYLILGRIMAAKQVTEELRKLGKPDIALENKISSFLGKPILPDEFSISYFNIDEEPVNFYTYLQQVIESITRFSRVGRKEICLKTINNVKNLVSYFAEKWNKLCSVLKLSGDFFIISYEVNNKEEYAKKAIGFYKKRAEIDRRAESFIDLAHALQLIGNDEGALMVLRKVLKVFKGNSEIWLNLGIAFALTNRYSYARHCLCVAAKLASDVEASRAYACCSAIANIIGDQELFKQMTDTARQYNPYDPDVWELLASKSNELSHLDSALIAFEFGSSNEILSILPSLCLRSNCFLEGLGYAFMSGNSKLISQAYESIGDYKSAMSYAEDDKTKQRLSLLLCKSTSYSPIFELYKNKSFEEAGKLFSEKDDFYNQIAYSICLHCSKEDDKAIEILQKIRANYLFLSKSIDKLILQFSTNSSSRLQSSFIEKDSEFYFLSLLSSNTRFNAAHLTIKKFSHDVKAMKLFLYELFANNQIDDPNMFDFALTISRSLTKTNPSTEAYTLYVISLLKTSNFEEAYIEIQKLCLMNPKIIPHVQKIIRKIKQN